MNTEARAATLVDWIICELSNGRQFLAGKVSDGPEDHSREGAYVTSSLVVSPVEAIADGNVVETQDRRYLLADRYRGDDALFAKLDAWMDAQPETPSLSDVLATGDRELFAAYFLRGFRKATVEAAWSHRPNP